MTKINIDGYYGVQKRKFTYSSLSVGAKSFIVEKYQKNSKYL